VQTQVVLGQVVSYNDRNWSVFWSRGPIETTAPSGGKLLTGKYVGEDGDKLVTLKLSGALASRRDMQHQTASKSRQRVALIYQSDMFKEKARRTPLILPCRPRPLLLFSLK
jgi:hypothetical protein